MNIAPLDIVVLTVDRLALASLLAASLAGLWLSTHKLEQRAVIIPLKRTVSISITLLVFSTFLLLALRTASLADVPLTETLPYFQKVIESSHYGTTWLGRVLALAVVILAWLASQRTQAPAGYALILGAAVSISFFISAASHAGENGLWTFENINNSLHIIGTCLWGGSVVVYVLFITQLNRQNIPLTDTANQLSRVATLALATVITTGLLNTWFRLTSISDLWTQDYGVILVLKLAFVLIMMAIGAANRFVLIPKLIKFETATTPAKISPRPGVVFHRVLRLDSLVFSIILIIAVILATQGPGH